jgi:DNA helicase-2/ATP-dependent DNA helicase PcrA
MMVRTNQEVADAIWIVHACGSLAEARFHEQLYSVRYGIPTLVFYVRGRRMAMNQQWVDRLFQEIDTEAGAARLMRDLDLDPRFPHHRPFAVVRGAFERRYVWFTMFGDPRPHLLRPWHEHRIQLITSGGSLRRKAEARFPVRAGKKDTWRIETSRKDHDEGLSLARAICELDDLTLVSRARLSPGKAFHFMPASHIHPAMVLPVLEGDSVVEDVVESVESISYDGEVYDLSVSNLRNFSAAGVLVHNSIYAWRGADIRNILDFERDFQDAAVVKLERNYRSTEPILGGASAVVAHNRERRDKTLLAERGPGAPIRLFSARDDREEAAFVVQSILAAARSERNPDGRPLGHFAVFYRTNAQSRAFEESCSSTRCPTWWWGASASTSAPR